jgi:hypothetical protein
MKTQASNNEAGNDNDVARELAQRLADVEVANNALREEIERKNKALEGFIAENEALKDELRGNRKRTGEPESKPPTRGGGKQGNTGGGLDGAGPKGLDDLVAQARRLGW